MKYDGQNTMNGNDCSKTNRTYPLLQSCNRRATYGVRIKSVQALKKNLKLSYEKQQRETKSDKLLFPAAIIFNESCMKHQNIFTFMFFKTETRYFLH